jgi:hypothetical protein
MNAKRKIVQISAAMACNPEEVSGFGADPIGFMTRVFGLCDDGTVWSLDSDNQTKWNQLPSIPGTNDEGAADDSGC